MVYVRYFPTIFPGDIGEIHETLKKNSRSMHRDSNPSLLEYEGEFITKQMRRSIIRFLIKNGCYECRFWGWVLNETD